MEIKTRAAIRRLLFIRALQCLSVFFILAFIPPTVHALEVSSVSPGLVSPGGSVAITGGPFTPQTRVLLGNREIEPSAVSEGRLVFAVPQVEDGEYALQVRDDGEISARSFILRVAAPDPRIDALSPSNIDICSLEGEREVLVQGRHFQPGATLLLDGKTIASSRVSSEILSFAPPPLAAGVYGIQAINPNGGRSVPRSLYVNDIPEIHNVYTGEEFVNYYQLVIEGKNFFFNSTLLVNEYLVGFFDLPPEQRVIPHQSSTSDPDKLASPRQSGNVRFVDCGTLIYNRYPYSTQPKNISLKIINPDGKTSSTWDISVP